MRHFCSYFDHRYLERGLAMHASLARFSADFRLYVLCLDDVCYDALARAGIETIVPIRLPDLEAHDRDLHAARARRSIVEFYFTLTPALPLYLFARFPDIDVITYLDSDLYFFDSFERVYDEIGEASVAIIPHRFSDTGKFRERYGVYNVGWVSWRRDTDGLACLEWYRRACIEWCFDHPDEVRFADQKYLDDWPMRFGNVRVIDHPGCNLAPWNLENYRFALDRERLLIDGKAIVFYHFQGLRDAYAPTLETTSIQMYATRPIEFNADLVISALYEPYKAAMTEAKARMEAMAVAPALASVELRHTDAPPAAVPVRAWRDALEWQAPEPAALAAWPEIRLERTAVLPPRVRDFSGDLVAQRDQPEMLLELALREALSRAGGDDLRVYHWSRHADEAGRLAQAWAAGGGGGLGPSDLPENAAIGVFGEVASEYAVFERIFARAARVERAIVLDGVRTFTFLPTRVVQRRVLGESEPHPIWVFNRTDLERRLRTLRFAIVRDFIWDESAAVPPLPERADRRTILAIRDKD